MNTNTPNEQDNETTKLKTWEVQYSLKWVNFTVEVEAESEKDAIQLAGQKTFSEFVATARNEEVSSLEDIFNLAGFPRAGTWH